VKSLTQTVNTTSRNTCFVLVFCRPKILPWCSSSHLFVSRNVRLTKIWPPTKFCRPFGRQIGVAAYSMSLFMSTTVGRRFLSADRFFALASLWSKFFFATNQQIYQPTSQPSTISMPIVSFIHLSVSGGPKDENSNQICCFLPFQRSAV